MIADQEVYMKEKSTHHFSQICLAFLAVLDQIWEIIVHSSMVLCQRPNL